MKFKVGDEVLYREGCKSTEKYLYNHYGLSFPIAITKIQYERSDYDGKPIHKIYIGKLEDGLWDHEKNFILSRAKIRNIPTEPV